MRTFLIKAWERPGYRVLRDVTAGDYRDVSRLAKAYVKPGRMVVVWEEDRPVCLYYWVPELRMIGAYYVGVKQP